MSLNAGAIKVARSRTQQPVLEVAGYAARLAWVIDLGVQAQPKYDGQEKPPVQQIYTLYELSDEYMVDEDGVETDRRRVIGEKLPLYSLSSDKAKSTKRYDVLDPSRVNGGDWSKLPATPCTVGVVQNPRDGVVWNNIGAVSSPPKMRGYVQPELLMEPVVFDMSSPDMEVYAALPDWIKTIIGKALNLSETKLGELLGQSAPVKEAAEAPSDNGIEDDDIPF